MFKKLKDQSKGFTIIEVLIVLAIAGLIMLIVFLAVPALNRNKRNTQARSDVAIYLGAVQEWSNNNRGDPPTTAKIGEVNALAKLAYLTPPTTVHTGARNTTVGPGLMELVTAARCDTSNNGNTFVPPGGVTARAIAVRFSVEGSNGVAIPQCQES